MEMMGLRVWEREEGKDLEVKRNFHFLLEQLPFLHDSIFIDFLLELQLVVLVLEPLPGVVAAAPLQHEEPLADPHRAESSSFSPKFFKHFLGIFPIDF